MQVKRKRGMKEKSGYSLSEVLWQECTVGMEVSSEWLNMSGEVGIFFFKS